MEPQVTEQEHYANESHDDRSVLFWDPLRLMSHDDDDDNIVEVGCQKVISQAAKRPNRDMECLVEVLSLLFSPST